MADGWPPPDGVCPRLDCNGIITAESLTLDPRGRGECGRCGTIFQWNDVAWLVVDEPLDKP
jgi:hypothetical protein